jgi:polysaccharide export outer membrane protein
MRGRHGCKFVAHLAVMAGLAVAGPGCQGTSLFSGQGGLLPNSQAGSAGSIFPISLGRPQAVGQSVAATSHAPLRAHACPGDTGSPGTVIATSAWRPVQRQETAPNGIVAVSNWQTNSAPSNPGTSTPSVPNPIDQPPALTSTQEPPSSEPPSLPVPRPLPVADGHPEAGLLPPPVPAAAHAPAGHAPAELSKVLMPPYIVEPPDILLIDSTADIAELKQPIRGQHLVRPDGTINLGIFGTVRVAGMTTEQIRAAVARAIDALRKPEKVREAPTKPEQVSVDVLAYNSKVYYIITDGAGYGEQVYRAPFTGNETVLDALSLINGLPPVASKKKIWVARRIPGHGGHYDNVLPVDWCAITQGGATATNYQIFPGDRIYVKSQSLIRFDNNLGKFLAPIERLFGTTLLGSETVNSIRNRTTTGGIP